MNQKLKKGRSTGLGCKMCWLHFCRECNIFMSKITTKIWIWICSYSYRYKKTFTMFITHIYIYIVGDHSRGWPEGSLFDSLPHQGVGEGATPFPGSLHFTLDPYLIMLSVKQERIKYHFLSLWYDSTWDWTQVSRANGEHSNR